jgi:hypothetical protein
MNPLAELKKRARDTATPATRRQIPGAASQESQESQRVNRENHFAALATSPLLTPLADTLKLLRAHLLALAAAGGIDAQHVHRLLDADLIGCIPLEAQQLAAHLAMLDDSAERKAGRIPRGHTASIHCRACGPVWVHPDMAAALPLVAGWPRALGCPWCFVRRAGGYIPRPSLVFSD